MEKKWPHGPNVLLPLVLQTPVEKVPSWTMNRNTSTEVKTSWFKGKGLYLLMWVIVPMSDYSEAVFWKIADIDADYRYEEWTKWEEKIEKLNFPVKAILITDIYIRGLLFILN